MNSRAIKIAWLAPYPPERLQPQLEICRSSKAHPAGWIVNLADALGNRDDVELHVVSATSGIVRNQTVCREGITFHIVRHTFPFTARGFPSYMRLDVMSRYAQLRRQIRRILLDLQPDVVHVHGTESGYGLAALETKLPTIVSIQGVVSALTAVSPSLFFKLQAPIEAEVIRHTKYFGTRTVWANEFVRSLNPSATIYNLPEAIDPLFFECIDKPRPPRILIVGSVVQRKGIEDAVGAMSTVAAAVPSAKLVVVGEGNPDYIAEMQRQAVTAGVADSIEWLGFKEPKEVAELHKDAAILIHPSYLDNSPNSVAEAMASGVAVIASKVGGIPSMIEAGVTGLLTEPGDCRQLGHAILWLLQNEEERKRLAGNARRVALERHLPSRVAQITADAYKDVILREKSLSVPYLMQEEPAPR